MEWRPAGSLIRQTFESVSRRSLRAGVASRSGATLKGKRKLRDQAGRSDIGTGSVSLRAKAVPGSGKLAAHLPVLLEWVEAAADITMPELAAKLAAEKKVTAHPASLSRVLLKAGLSFKKNSAGLGNRARGRASGA